MPKSVVVWHDVECAAYAADLDLWRDLAEEHGGPVLDLGCGTGRVALDLARRGHDVVGLDADERLVSVLNARATEQSLPARAVAGDARSFGLETSFPLILLPMQVAQLLGGSAGRTGMLKSAARHLREGGRMAIALADPFEGVEAGEMAPPAPDVLEVEGWVYSSTPIAVHDEPESVRIDRIRETVSPEGDLTEEIASITLDSCAPTTLEQEAGDCGLTLLDRRLVPATPDYVASTVVMLGAAT